MLRRLDDRKILTGKNREMAHIEGKKGINVPKPCAGGDDSIVDAATSEVACGGVMNKAPVVIRCEGHHLSRLWQEVLLNKGPTILGREAIGRGKARQNGVCLHESVRSQDQGLTTIETALYLSPGTFVVFMP